MFRKSIVFGTTLGLLAGALLLGARPALADDPAGVIKGLVFTDANENIVYDEGEPTLAGVELEFASGDSTVRVTTDADGAFALPVNIGLWRVALILPEGYSALNDASREVTIAADGVTEAVMTFALKAPPAAESAVVESESPAPAAEPAQTTLLPESGASLSWGLIAVTGFAAMFVAGVLLIASGRRLARR